MCDDTDNYDNIIYRYIYTDVELLYDDNVLYLGGSNFIGSLYIYIISILICVVIIIIIIVDQLTL